MFFLSFCSMPDVSNNTVTEVILHSVCSHVDEVLYPSLCSSYNVHLIKKENNHSLLSPLQSLVAWFTHTSFYRQPVAQKRELALRLNPGGVLYKLLGGYVPLGL